MSAPDMININRNISISPDSLPHLFQSPFETLKSASSCDLEVFELEPQKSLLPVKQQSRIIH
jgi:hypothetical protein